ncbi:MAG: DUF559 domain-containing protein [Robiginitomaculum sp.]|nr:DUF559 domain-containing protein [Robiginitomaculum sp.]
MRKSEKKSRRFAKDLRKNMTEAEHKLWSHIRRKLLDGYRFRRQHPVGPFIVDFICIAEKLIIEVDGATHGDDAEIAYDERRTKFLETHGWKIVRYGNEEIYKSIDDVLDDIYAHLKGLKV